MNPNNAATKLGNVIVDCRAGTIEIEFTMATNDTARNKIFYTGYATNEPDWATSVRSTYTNKDVRTRTGFCRFRLDSLDLSRPIYFAIDSFTPPPANAKIGESAEFRYNFPMPAAPTNLQIISKIGSKIDIQWNPVANIDDYFVYYDTVPPSRVNGFRVPSSAVPRATLASLENDTTYSIWVRSRHCGFESANSNVLNVETSLERCVRIQDKMDVEMNRRQYHLDSEKMSHLLQKFFMKIRDYYTKTLGLSENNAYMRVKEYFLHPVSLKPGSPALDTLHFRLYNILLKNPTPKLDREGKPLASETQLFLDRYFPGMSKSGKEETLRENYFRDDYPGGAIEFEKLKRVLEFEYKLKLETQLRFVLRGNPPQLSGKASEEFAYIFLYNKLPNSATKDNLLVHLSIADPLRGMPLRYHLTDKCYGPRSVLKPGGGMTTGGLHQYFRFIDDAFYRGDPLTRPYKILNNGNLFYTNTGNTLYLNGTRKYNMRHFTDPKIAPLIPAANLPKAQEKGYTVPSPFKMNSQTSIEPFKHIPIQYEIVEGEKKTQLDIEGNIIEDDESVETPDGTKYYLVEGHLMIEYPDESVEDVTAGTLTLTDGTIKYRDGRIKFPNGMQRYVSGDKFVDVRRDESRRVLEVWSPAGRNSWYINYPQRGETQQEFWNPKTKSKERIKLEDARRMGKQGWLYKSGILHQSDDTLSLRDRTRINISKNFGGGSRKRRRETRRASKKTMRKRG